MKQHVLDVLFRQCAHGLTVFKNIRLVNPIETVTESNEMFSWC